MLIDDEVASSADKRALYSKSPVWQKAQRREDGKKEARRCRGYIAWAQVHQAINSGVRTQNSCVHGLFLVADMTAPEGD